MDKISKIFGGMSFVRIARIFLLHPEMSFSPADIREKTHLDPSDVRVIMNDLAGAGVIKKKGSKWTLDRTCEFIKPLHELLIGELLSDINLSKRIQRCGNVKLLVAAGVFLDNSESRTDLLLVVDKLNQKSLARTISALEADVGGEVRYAVFTPEEFTYRMSVNDKLIRDVFDYPHEKIINKILP